MIDKITINKLIDDEHIKKMEGEFIDYDDTYTLIVKNTDIYKKNGDILLKFRKNVIKPEICEQSIKSFYNVTKSQNDNRGAAGGKIDFQKILNKRPYLKNKFIKTSKFRTYMIKENGTITKSHIANPANSGIVGWFDKGTRIGAGKHPPCRLTAYTKKYFEKYINGLILFHNISELYQNLSPNKFNIQLNEANKTKAKIEGTCFSTVTVNRNFRTALHKDSGDFSKGLGNLTVSGYNFSGSYLLFPQYKIAVNILPGDFIMMDVHEWHCNSEIIPLKKDYLRLSFVCYLRENMVKACSNNPPKNLLR